MKIINIDYTVFPEVKIVRSARFPDNRGYFTEVYKKSDFEQIDFLKCKVFVQINESYSKKGVIRGLHYQHSPFQEKLVRVINGKMIDLFLDIRPNSPTYGKIGSHLIETNSNNNIYEWIWLPVGFAHGLLMLEDTTIEYNCTSEYSPSTELSITPLDPDIDWSLVDKSVADLFKQNLTSGIISDRDKAGFSLKDWSQNEISKLFNI